VTVNSYLHPGAIVPGTDDHDRCRCGEPEASMHVR
jgi:hypothetical protein